MIKYIEGDATKPQGAGIKAIVHCCNDIGAWGAGFVIPLAKRYPITEQRYRQWMTSAKPGKLGDIQEVWVAPDVVVYNMIGQHMTGQDEHGNPPIRYWAINDGLDEICLRLAGIRGAVQCLEVSIHAPRFGAGLAGGNWDILSAILDSSAEAYGIPVTVYDLPRSKPFDLASAVRVAIPELYR